MLRFEIAPPKNRSEMFSDCVWVPSNCLCCFHTNSQAQNVAIRICDFETQRFAISFRDFCCDFSVEPAVRIVTLNFRLEIAAILIAILWDAKILRFRFLFGWFVAEWLPLPVLHNMNQKPNGNSKTFKVVFFGLRDRSRLEASFLLIKPPAALLKV